MRQNEPSVRSTAQRLQTNVATAAVFLAAAGTYVGVRVGAPSTSPTFLGACQRLRGSGLPMTPNDWFCRQAPWTWHASALVTSLLVWIAFVLPCAILASTGRRFTAILPMAVAPFLSFMGYVDFFQVRWWGTPYWPTHPLAAVALNAVLIVLPVGVIAVRSRARVPRPGTDPSMASAAAAGSLLALPTVGIVVVASRLFARHLSSVGYEVSWHWLVPGALSMVVFGALLGPNRRWWPWSAAPIAILLSLGPMGAVSAGPLRWVMWSQFGAAVPFAVVGVSWAAWWPLSLALTRRLQPARAPIDPERTLAVRMDDTPAESTHDVTSGSPHERERPLRPVVALNALAISLLAVSLIMFRADPMPFQIGTSLPTYLGARAQWRDVRARMDLREAIAAADDHGAAHGDVGFTARAGAAADDSLAWMDLADVTSDHTPMLTMVVSVEGRRTHIGVVSESGSAFCIGRTGTHGILTYGNAEPSNWSDGSAPFRALSQAFANCDHAPWTAQLENALPIETFCAGQEQSESYLICRMVQVLGAKIMSTPKPE